MYYTINIYIKIQYNLNLGIKQNALHCFFLEGQKKEFCLSLSEFKEYVAIAKKKSEHIHILCCQLSANCLILHARLS